MAGPRTNTDARRDELLAELRAIDETLKRIEGMLDLIARSKQPGKKAPRTGTRRP